ncbi:hypothetical protein PRZ48_006441 [Zasmidium cellare]|uniref:Arabinogalactan endo-beta-1,4-galactanase n=1 Tax=Zasmidium cellare TaxID=395010 RepID=A0ABR0EN41_ZASCE|nr:hypothetical protein PRZ48_006441 [Zasmidium cellare]
MKTLHLLPLLATAATAALTYKGVDWSSLLVEEADGTSYSNTDGTVQPLETILTDSGVNVVRQRIWVDPSDGNYDLDYNLELAQRAQAAGLDIYLDFHFSSTWADPTHQTTPSAWADYGIDDLAWAVYNNTLSTMNSFQSAGITLSLVSIGNEITAGMLWPLGDIDETDGPYNLARLLHSASAGIKDSDISPQPKILVHLDNGWNYDTQEWWYDTVLEQGPFTAEDYDVQAVSYYPFYNSAATLSSLSSSLSALAQKYGKEVMVVETNWPFECSNPAYAFPDDTADIPFSAEGQTTWMKRVAEVIEGAEMSAILEDASVWDSFFPPPPPNQPPIEESLPIDILEWYSDATTNARVDPPIKTAKSLITCDEDPSSTCTLRIVFLPRDSPDLPGDLALKAIYRHYAFPSQWLTERLRNVTHSFGGHQVLSDPNVSVAWTRLVCKDVQIQETFKVGKLQFYEIVDGTERFPRGGSQDSSAWWHLDAFVHVRERYDGSRCVTLLCFSRREDVVGRFEGLLRGDAWEDAVEDPYLLFSILLEKWYLTLDRVAWRLADVFRPIEILTLRRSNRRKGGRSDKEDEGEGDDDEQLIPDLDFAGLHNLSKHCTYLLEAASATLLVLENMAHHHRFLHTTTPKALSNAAASFLTYRKTTLQSTQLRLQSLSNRMSNLISLSFNLVTQEDSQTMKNDSHAMKAIAILTLIFLPLTGIGSVFSTPFFDVDFDEGSRVLRVAGSIWIFWDEERGPGWWEITTK